MAIDRHSRSLVMAAMAIAAGVLVAGCGDPLAPLSRRASASGATATSHTARSVLDCEVTIESSLTRVIGTDAKGVPSIECVPSSTAGGGGTGPGRTAFASDTILERFDDIGFTYGTPTWSLVLGAGSMSVPIRLVNHIAKPLGTSDGVHVASNGTRVFIMSGPTVLVGGGLGVLPTVTVSNSSGTGTFTTTGQMYFQYPGIIQPDSASAPVTWTFTILDTSKFNFQVGVDGITP